MPATIVMPATPATRRVNLRMRMTLFLLGYWCSSVPPMISGLLIEAVRVIPEELFPCVRLEARPRKNVVDRFGELTLRVRVVRGIHQHPVTEILGDGVEHILALLALDATEEAAAGQVFARFQFERCGAADIDELLVHTPRPERQPAEAAFEHTHSEARVTVHDAGADEGGDKPHSSPRMRGEPAEEDVVPDIAIGGVVWRIPGRAVVRDR